MQDPQAPLSSTAHQKQLLQLLTIAATLPLATPILAVKANDHAIVSECASR
jgi:hypothetical protein